MTRKTYPSEFKKEAASLVLDQGYTITAACESMGVGKTAMNRWVKQLRSERSGNTPESVKAITKEHQEIQSLKERVRRLELEKEILKKATALLMSDQHSI